MNERLAADSSANAMMWPMVPRLLAQHHYLVLGTVGPAGDPWVTPVFFVADGTDSVLWVSAPTSRHSLNIARHPAVAITVFDTQSPIGGAEALYLEATASVVDDTARPAAIELLNSHLPKHQHLDLTDAGPAGQLQVYRASIRQHYVLIRGGDARFDNPVDTRLAVANPDS
ncbi:pyridoxamine 5'-phosphate oxidase family protein [Kribbella antibiotica]|uniref:Pyridoxamine 5'-phosphate oxidase family protein n=1 Tax=Kribbella antibiotica TaxID=190195 RepID=A0A4R4YTA5_9ACTN|nr:pyridoxamine 5'-phosphate oxidase family protein [Kribbella antibiotica]TDD48545.1 pyridoxamine 5'-phosphate oxidase family protein [Kribbella antibiotica]